MGIRLFGKRVSAKFITVLIMTFSILLILLRLNLSSTAGEVIHPISIQKSTSFQSPITIGSGSIIGIAKIFLTISGEVIVTSPMNRVFTISFTEKDSAQLSRIFALNEAGEYHIEETYKIIIRLEGLVNHTEYLTETDEWNYNISTPSLILFCLEDTYIDNHSSEVKPDDTFMIYDTTSYPARPGDEGRLYIKVLRKIVGGEMFNISINLNGNWHKTSSVNFVGKDALILEEGWNLISFLDNKCFYRDNLPNDQPSCIEKVNVNNMNFKSLSEWFSSILTPHDAWQIVIGTNGAMDNSLPSALHSLKYMSSCSGYWVKIKDGVGLAFLLMNVLPFNANYIIPLAAGWNLVGYLSSIGYYDTDVPPSNLPWVDEWVKVNSPVAKYVFKSVSGKYSMIVGEDGAYNPEIPTIFNSLHYIAPGCAYWVKMKESANLIYPSEPCEPFHFIYENQRKIE